MSAPKSPVDPLKIRLTRPWRLGIMFFLITSFFILAPSLILYTSGFRFNVSEGGFSTTGVISIDTEPTDAHIYLNNTLVSNEQPLRLDGLVPGVYQVRISKDGFHDFHTVITLRSKETSYIKGVTLFPKTSPVLLLATSTESINTVGFVNSNPENFFYTTQTSTSNTLNLVNRANADYLTKQYHSTRPITCSIEKNHCVWWSENSKTIHLLGLESPEKEHIFIKTMTTWQWSDHKNNLGFFENKDGIQRVDTNYTTTPVRFATSGLWFIDSNNTIFLATESVLEQQPDSTKKIAVTLPNKIIRIISATQNFALVQLPEFLEIVTGLTHNPTHQTIRADKFFIDSAAGRILAWSDWELTSINKQTGDHGFLYRSAEPLRFVRGLEPDGSLLMIINNSVTAFNPGYVTTQTLATFTTIKAVEVDQKSRTIIIAGNYHDQSGIFTLAY